MRCAEIGSFEGGGSLVIVEHLCLNPESKLFCIDPFDDEYVKGNEKMAFWDHACKGQLSRFRHNTAGCPKIVECRGTSDAMIPTLEDKSLDFAYIDGDHSPEQVYKDAMNILGKMKPGGIILFDDYLWAMNGVVTRPGIDLFLQEAADKVTLIFKDYQLAVRVL